MELDVGKWKGSGTRSTGLKPSLGWRVSAVDVRMSQSKRAGGRWKDGTGGRKRYKMTGQMDWHWLAGL